MQIARHKNQSIILISQTSRRIDRDLFYPVDIYLLKKPTLFQLLEERPVIQHAYRRIQELDGKPNEVPNIQVNEFYWMDSDKFEKGTFQKPVWYSSELSKAYAESAKTQTQTQFKTPAAPRVSSGNQRFIQPLRSTQRLGAVKKNSLAQTRTGVFQKLTQLSPSLPRGGSGFDPAGLVIALVLGMIGFFILVKGAWAIAVIPLLLAVLSFVASHKHFEARR
jgi:hypothetical protein